MALEQELSISSPYWLSMIRCAARYKRFSVWAKEVEARPAPKNPLARKQKKKAEADSEQALVAAIR